MATPIPGMGAIPFDGGVAFRVWAPFASRVAVAGTFSGWTERALDREGGGFWSGDVPEAAAGDEYKFVIEGPTGPLWRNDPYALRVTGSGGNSVVTRLDHDWSASGYRTPSLDELVIYEMHVGTFHDDPGGRPGRFASALARLDHLAELGVNAVELMPAYEFAADFSLGYNPAHLFAVESAYGGPEGLLAFVDEAHRRGIAVLLDVVYNHFGPEDLDLWRFDGWSERDLGGIYFYNDRRAETPWGMTRPDYGRPEVRRFIRDNVFHWLDRFRIDGLRFDATAHIRTRGGREDSETIQDGWELLRSLNAEVRERAPWKLCIAEDLQGNPGLTALADEGGCGFAAQWDGAFAGVLRAALVGGEDAFRDLAAVARAVERGPGAGAFSRVVYTESHDAVDARLLRIPEAIFPGNASSWPARKRSTLGAALVMTAPGVPMLFQGQELLENEWFRDEDPIDWSKKERHRGVFELYRDLVRLRRNWWDHTRGLRGPHVHVFHRNDRDKVLAFHRWAEGGPRDDVVVLANLSTRPFAEYVIGLPRAGRWRARLSTDWGGYGADFGGIAPEGCDAAGPPRDGLAQSGTLAVGAYAAVILSQDG